MRITSCPYFPKCPPVAIGMKFKFLDMMLQIISDLFICSASSFTSLPYLEHYSHEIIFASYWVDCLHWAFSRFLCTSSQSTSSVPLPALSAGLCFHCNSVWTFYPQLLHNVHVLTLNWWYDLRNSLKIKKNGIVHSPHKTRIIFTVLIYFSIYYIYENYLLPYIYFLKLFIYLCVQVFYFHLHLCTTCMSDAGGGQRTSKF